MSSTSTRHVRTVASYTHGAPTRWKWRSHSVREREKSRQLMPRARASTQAAPPSPPPSSLRPMQHARRFCSQGSVVMAPAIRLFQLPPSSLPAAAAVAAVVPAAAASISRAEAACASLTPHTMFETRGRLPTPTNRTNSRVSAGVRSALLRPTPSASRPNPCCCCCCCCCCCSLRRNRSLG